MASTNTRFPEIETSMKHIVRLCALILAGSALCQPVFAHAGHGKTDEKVQTRQMGSLTAADKARDYFTDTVLVSHTGKEMRFYSDILEDKTVVLNFMFTTCPDACPLINTSIQRVQERLKDRIGKDIYIVSITVDPETDTVKVLADYRKKYKAMPGWLFLTGTPENLETVGQKMGQVFEKDAHLTALLVGNTKTARWRKIPPHLSDALIAAQIKDIADGVYD